MKIARNILLILAGLFLVAMLGGWVAESYGAGSATPTWNVVVHFQPGTPITDASTYTVDTVTLQAAVGSGGTPQRLGALSQWTPEGRTSADTVYFFHGTIAADSLWVARYAAGMIALVDYTVGGQQFCASMPPTSITPASGTDTTDANLVLWRDDGSYNQIPNAMISGNIRSHLSDGQTDVIDAAMIADNAIGAAEIAANAIGNSEFNVTETLNADMVSVSGDGTAADNFETMLDGTGGNALTLGQLRLEAGTDDTALIVRADGGSVVPAASFHGGTAHDVIAFESPTTSGDLVDLTNSVGVGLQVGSASGAGIQGGIDTVYDTVAALATANVDYDTLASIVKDTMLTVAVTPTDTNESGDTLARQGDSTAFQAKSVVVSSNGDYPETLYVYDSANSAIVVGADVAVLQADTTTPYLDYGTTNASGYVILDLDAGTFPVDVDAATYYSESAYQLVTQASPGGTDTVWVYSIQATPPSGADSCAVLAFTDADDSYAVFDPQRKTQDTSRVWLNAVKLTVRDGDDGTVDGVIQKTLPRSASTSSDPDKQLHWKVTIYGPDGTAIGENKDYVVPSQAVDTLNAP